MEPDTELVKANGASSIEEFKAAALAERVRRAVVIKLPSGMSAKLVRMTPDELFLRTGRFPQGIAAKIAPSPSNEKVDPDKVIQFARVTVEMVEYIFVEPRVPEDLKPGQDIPYSDIDFALAWARGEVTDDGQRLATFPGDRSGAERAAAS